tara:strand:- start:4557 stop:5009 length:453 start_codon:yes stop_codon:yes gene_type:complete
MKLSGNFTLGEMIKSQTALRKGIDNTPEPEHIANMKAVCMNILEPVREFFGLPIIPSSGYRSKALCRAIGSSEESQHAKGEAVDFEVAGIDNYELARWIRDNLAFDQLILEYYSGGNSGWVHCSYVPNGRKEVLTMSRQKGYQRGLIIEV